MTEVDEIPRKRKPRAKSPNSRPPTAEEIRASETAKRERKKANARAKAPSQRTWKERIFETTAIGVIIAFPIIVLLINWLQGPADHPSHSYVRPVESGPYSCQSAHFDAANCAAQRKSLQYLGDFMNQQRR